MVKCLHCTVCHLVCELVLTALIKQSHWLTIISGCGILFIQHDKGLKRKRCEALSGLQNCWLIWVFPINLYHTLGKFSRQKMKIQYNLNGSNTDGSFTVDDSNSFFSPYKILPIAQENKYLGIFFLILSWNCMLCTR